MNVGFAGRYKVGAWTPVEVTIHGGSEHAIGRVRATVADSDNLNCSYDALEPCEILPGQDATVLLYVRFGHDAGKMDLRLFDSRGTLAEKSIDSILTPAPTPGSNSTMRFAPINGLLSAWAGVHRAGKVCGGERFRSRTQASDRQAMSSPCSIALPGCPRAGRAMKVLTQVVISTSQPEIFQAISPQNVRIEALDQWVRAGGTLVLCAGSHAEEALRLALGKVCSRPLGEERDPPRSGGMGDLRRKQFEPHSWAPVARQSAIAHAQAR